MENADGWLMVLGLERRNFLLLGIVWKEFVFSVGRVLGLWVEYGKAILTHVTADLNMSRIITGALVEGRQREMGNGNSKRRINGSFHERKVLSKQDWSGLGRTLPASFGNVSGRIRTASRWSRSSDDILVLDTALVYHARYDLGIYVRFITLHCDQKAVLFLTGGSVMIVSIDERIEHLDMKTYTFSRIG